MSIRNRPGACGRAACLCAPLLLLAGCAAEPALPTDRFAQEPPLVETRAAAPPGAAPGSCWGKDVTPAVIETQTDQVVDRPTGLRPDGSPHPAVYRTETRQVIVQERREIWFETPCPEDLTPDFVASLQRALVARGLLHVPPSGVMDNLTRRAIRLYQRRQGLDSSILSLAAARSLGLAAVAREE